jgi:hypothetical protein
MVILALIPAITTAHSGETYLVCNLKPENKGFLTLRSCGSNNCEILMRMPANTGLLALEPYSGSPWREVTVRSGLHMLPVGPDGWVHDKYICEISD